MTTHFVRPDAIDATNRIARAVCGRMVMQKEISGEPECRSCAKWRDDYDALGVKADKPCADCDGCGEVASNGLASMPCPACGGSGRTA